MSTPEDVINTPIPVRIIADETVATKVKPADRPFIFNTKIPATAPQVLLPHAPKRIRAVLSVLSGSFYLGESQSAMQTISTSYNDTACTLLTGPIPYMVLTGTSEVWCVLKEGSPIIGLIQEFTE